MKAALQGEVEGGLQRGCAANGPISRRPRSPPRSPVRGDPWEKPALHPLPGGINERLSLGSSYCDDLRRASVSLPCGDSTKFLNVSSSTGSLYSPLDPE